jgi:hypothetical protein
MHGAAAQAAVYFELWWHIQSKNFGEKFERKVSASITLSGDSSSNETVSVAFQ